MLVKLADAGVDNLGLIVRAFDLMQPLDCAVKPVARNASCSALQLADKLLQLAAVGA